jgi:outer membrane receptor protein involved in Fe transport
VLFRSWQSPFQDPLLANLSASIDYYNIELEDAIGTISASTMIQQCYNSNGTSNPTYDPNNFYCQLFTRDPLSGNIINPQSNNQNLASNRISGVDFQVDWAYDIGPGTLDAGVVGSWLENADFQSLPGGAFIEQTGTISSGTASAYPEWKFTADAGYRWGTARISARWQRVGEMKNFNNLAVTIPEIDYFDLIGSYDLTDNLSLRFTVNNITDEQPPFYTPSVQANTDPSTYDVLGRRYTVGITARF